MGIGSGVRNAGVTTARWWWKTTRPAVGTVRETGAAGMSCLVRSACCAVCAATMLGRFTVPIGCVKSAVGGFVPEGGSRAERRWLRWMEVGRRTGCHQRPDRSFFIRGWQFPVCARCSGVFLGYLIAAILYFIVRPPVWLILSAAFLMFLDWFLQYKGWLSSSNIRRFLTGICGGYAVMSVYVFVIVWMISQIKLWIGG